MYTNPSVADFKTFFARDFNFNVNPDVGITDADITRAFSEVDCQINKNLFPDQDCYNLGFYYLSAHYLVLNIKNASQGVSSQYEFLLNSKSVGSVSVGINIPDEVRHDTTLSMYLKTGYGAKYLELVLPYTRGNMYVVRGATYA